MALLRRRIDLTFQLGTGSFGDGGFNTVKVSGLRVEATISKAGGVSLTDCNLRVYGLPLSIMNQLFTLNKQMLGVRRNTLTVEAGDDQMGMATVFIGTIFQAWVDGQNQPDVAFTVEAHTGLLDKARPVAPTSIKGGADAAFILSGLAQQMGYNFENSGVSVQLMNPHFSGTLLDQAQACARAADINMIVDDNTLAIWPKNGARNGAAAVISPDTGMIGYPSWTANGLVLTTLFNPTITYGGTIKVESVITPACGIWTPFKIEHDLTSETPNGNWYTRLEATVLGHTAIASG